MSELFYTKKHVSDLLSDEEKRVSDAYCEDYKDFLNHAKDEREAVCTAIALAEAKGFRPYIAGDPIAPGDKLYRSVRGKSLFLAVVGKAPLSMGANIAAAHVDSPGWTSSRSPCTRTTAWPCSRPTTTAASRSSSG
jgi:aspartyl aminopeptidase